MTIIIPGYYGVEVVRKKATGRNPGRVKAAQAPKQVKVEKEQKQATANAYPYMKEALALCKDDTDYNAEKKTSHEWHQLSRLKIDRPTGWGSESFESNFYDDEISHKEFVSKLLKSSFRVRTDNSPLAVDNNPESFISLEERMERNS